MKKYICLLLVLLMTMTFVPFAGTAEDIDGFFDTLAGETGGEVSAEIDENADLSYLQLLISLDIIDETDAQPENVFKTVSRAKTVRHILKLLGYDDETISGNAIRGYFTDVNAKTPYASEIEFATSIGIVAGYDDGTFRPDAQVSYNEVLKLVIAALGYTAEAERNGGYYVGYFLTAYSLKLTKNAPQEEINLFGTVARIIYNALNTKTLTGTYSNSDVAYTKNNSTLLNDAFDAKMYTGVLEAVGKSSIYGYADETEGQMTISGVRFENGMENASDYIGRKVRFYTFTDESSIYETVFNMEVMPVNVIETFDIDDVEDPGDNRIYYTNAEYKKDYVKVNSETNILYNGRGMSYDKDMITPVENTTNVPMEGDITSIDNDGDNIADVVIVNSYWSFYADSVIAKQGMVADYYYAQFDPDNKYYYFLKPDDTGDDEQYIYKNDKEISLAEIRAKNVVSVQKSSNGISDVYTLTVTDNKLTGEVTAIDGRGAITVGGERYELSEYYKHMQDVSGGEAPEFRLGDTIEVYLDMFGKITGCSTVTRKKTGDYYFMFGFGGSRNKLEIDVMSNLGTMETLVIDEKVRYKGKNASEAESVNPGAIYTEWENAGYLNAPLRILLNSSGKVDYIELVELTPIPSAEINQGNVVINDVTSEYVGGMIGDAELLTVSGKTAKFAIGYGAPGAPWDETDKRAENYNLPVYEKYSYKMTANLATTKSFTQTNYVISHIDMVYVADYDASTGEIGLLIVDSLPNDEYHNGIFSNSTKNAEEMARKYPSIASFAKPATYSNAAATTAHTRFFGEWVRFDVRDTRSTNLLMVNEVIETRNEDGDLVKTIIGISKGEEISIDVRPDCVFWSTTTRADASAWFEPVDIYDMEANANLANRYYQDYNGAQPEILPGDVYAYVKKMDGSIQELYFVANMDEGPTVYGSDPDANPVPKHHVSFGGNMKWGFCFGAVHGIYGNTLYLRDRSNTTSKGEFTYSMQDGVEVQNFTINSSALYMWDFDRQQFIVANRNEHLIPSYMTYNELPESKYSGGSKKGQEGENNVWMIVANQHWKEQIEMIFADYYDAERYIED